MKQDYVSGENKILDNFLAILCRASGRGVAQINIITTDSNPLEKQGYLRKQLIIPGL